MDPSLVRIIGSTGKEGKGENQFAQPRGICIDSVTKEIFVVDCNNHRVQVYHLSSSAYIRQIGKGVQGDAPGALNYAVGVCLDDANQIYVADTNNHRIAVFNRITGGHVRNISSQGTAPGFLFSPYGVCVDTYEGVLYVADYDNHRVQAFNKNSGEFIRVIGLGYGSGDGQLNQPIVICIDYEFDHLLVADYSNNRIAVFNKESGLFLRNIGTNAGPNNLSGPRGLCISKEANILFVADRENHRIQLFDKATYAFLRTVGNGMGSSPGQFIRPMEICVDTGEGVLLVVDGYNHRVQILELPELQAEKRRLKAAAQRKAEAEQRGKAIPKPSLLAVSTQLTGQERVYVDAQSGGVRLRFDTLGSLYDMHLSEHDVPLLLAHLASLCTHKETNFSTSIDGERRFSSPVLHLPDHLVASEPQETSMAERQAELFLSVLEGLCPASPASAASSATEKGNKMENKNSVSAHLESSAYLLVTPALFALHSLLERGWTPSHVSAPVIALLADFLANISSGIVAENERMIVREAIVRVLRAATIASTNSQQAVLGAVLQSLAAPVKYQIGLPEKLFTNVIDTSPKNHVSILMAYFELLGQVFATDIEKCTGEELTLASCKKISFPREATSPLMDRSYLSCSQSAPLSSTSFTHERRRQSAQQRADILQFVFGTHFMRTVTESQAPKSQSLSAESTHTLSVSPFPVLPPVDALGNFLPHADGAMAQEAHPAFAADPRVPVRSPLKPSSSNNNTPNKPMKMANDITVPPELSTLIDTVFQLQQLRKAQSFVPLADFCQKGESFGDTPNDTVLASTEVSVLQLKLFQCATSHLHSLRSCEDDTQSSLSPKHHGDLPARRSRGGRNIWRLQEPLAVGDLVDAQDKERCWFESIVQEIFVDGSVKVHFMGWGSKWDDILTATELTTRIAPLNSKTKNWRADLFKGGLIEIKCNDDPVNQKWMWGRITALNVEEAWVEVSYLFSNEPTVVKRAWLFGETICPVGMHTKDKSKAAAALVVRPLKKMEDFIKEKSERGDVGDEVMFFDRSDDFEEPLEWDTTEDVTYSTIEATSADAMSALVAESGSGRSTPFIRLRSHSALGKGNNPCPAVGDIHFLIKTVPADAMQHVSRVGLNIMECLMRELLMVTLPSGPVNTTHLNNATIDDSAASLAQSVRDAALQLLRFIASTSFRRLLVPYFTRVATFHSGMRAKLMCGGLLSAQVTSVLHSGLHDVDAILFVLARFGELSTQYCAVMRQVFDLSLSDKALNEITSRIEATVDRCGVTQIANDLIEYILKQENLRYELFAHFVGENRFGERSAKLRKVLSCLFKAASRAESLKFQALFEGTLMRRELATMSFLPQYTSFGEVDQTWAMKLMQSLTVVYESAQSVSQMELLHIPQCRLAAERALQRECSVLSVEHLNGVALALATVLNCLLDPVYQPEVLPLQKIKSLRGMLDLQKIIIGEELLHHFRPVYESHLARRLLSGRYASVAAEKAVLEALPQLSRASKMLLDVTQGSYQSDFSRYLMAKIDNEEIEYSPVLGMVLQKQKVAVKVLCHATWARYVPHAVLFANLRLPAPMLTIQTQFDEFYQTTARVTKGSCSRRLTWQHGVGQVTLSCVHQRSSRSVEVKVNEAQAAVLWLFNDGCQRKTVSEICLTVNLSLEEMRGVLQSLSDTSHQLPLLTINPSGVIELSTVITLSASFVDDCLDDVASERSSVNEGVGLDYIVSAERFVKHADMSAAVDWRSEQIDACVVRVLKTAARRGAGRTGVISGDELLAGVLEELSKRNQRRNTVYCEDEVFCRVDRLVSLNYIDKVNLSAARGGTITVDNEDSASLFGISVGYAYLSSDDIAEEITKAGPSVVSSMPTGEALFEALVELVDAGDVANCTPSEPTQSDASLAEQSDSEEGEGKGDDCNESKRSDSLLPAATANIASFQSASSDPVPLSERVLSAEQLMRGIVLWTSSVRPTRTPSLSSTDASTKGSPEEDSVQMTLPASRNIASTPPRPERRLSNRFSNVVASPLRFGETSKRNSFSVGGSESKSGFEVSLIHGKYSGDRPPPPPLVGSLGRLSFTSSARALPSSQVKTFSTTATTQLSVIKERAYETLGETVSQLNKLIYQHHLGTLHPALRAEIGHFPPPSIETFITNVGKALTADARELNDWSDLHRELFLTLPANLIEVVYRKYCALLESPPDLSHVIANVSDLWTRRFPLLTDPAESDDAKDVSNGDGAENSKRSLFTTKLGTASSENVLGVLKLSLYEYVFSTFACDHPRSLESASADALEKRSFRMDQLQVDNVFAVKTASLQNDISGTHAAESGASGGSSGSKSDKKRTRHRTSRPSTASPHQSRSGRTFVNNEDPPRLSGLMNASLFADSKNSSPFTVPFGTWNDASSLEYGLLDQSKFDASKTTHNQSLLADQSSERSSGDDSSRSSSRSNSNGDFTVAQLMQSIESELRNSGERNRDNDGNKRGASALDAGYAFASPPVYWDLLSRESDNKGKYSSQNNPSLLSPPQSGELFEPKKPAQFMPSEFSVTETSSALSGAINKSYNISLSNLRSPAESPPRSSALKENGSDSLQDLLRTYQAEFQDHILNSFWEPQSCGNSPVEKPPLGQDAMNKMVCLLLQGAARRVSEASPSEPVAAALWFLGDKDISLSGIFEAAVNVLTRNRNSKELRMSDFDQEANSAGSSVSTAAKNQLTDEVLNALCASEGFSPENLQIQTRKQQFHQIALAVATALNSPAAGLLPRLVRFHWDASRMIDAFFSGQVQEAMESKVNRTYLRLSESFNDQFTRGVNVQCASNSDNVSGVTAPCDKCHAQSSCEELFALRCRHFACRACWSAHIQQAITLGAGHTTCLHCSVEKHSCTERAGADLIITVSDSILLTAFMQNRMKLYSQDFHNSNVQRTCEFHEHILKLMRLPQGECLSPTKSSPVTSATSATSAKVSISASTTSGLPMLAVSPGTSGGSVSRMLPPARVRSPATATLLHAAQLRSGGGTPTRPATQAASPRADRDASALPRLFSGLSPFSTPRSAANLGVGVAANSTRPWASENSEGNTSKFLAETRVFMCTRAAELKAQQKNCQEENKFRFLCNQMNVIAQFLRAIAVVECVENMLPSAERRASKSWLFFVHEALEALRDLLIVTNIKVRSKWQTPEGLTDAAANEALACLHVRMLRLAHQLKSHHAVKKKSGTGSVGIVLDLLPSQSAPWLPFCDPRGCEVLKVGLLNHVNPAPAAPAISTAASSKFSECRNVIEQLADHGTMTESVLLKHLQAVEDLLNNGYQTVLFANNICYVLMSVCNQRAESISVRHAVLSLMVKLTDQDPHCAAALVDLGVWGCWAALLAQRRIDTDVCLTCASLMLNLFSASEMQRNAAMDLFDVQQGFDLLISVLHTHSEDVKVSRAVHLAVLQAVDKTFTAESSFVQSGMCEVLIASLLQYSAHPGVKMQFVTLLERIATGNKFMQERLKELEVFEHVIELISEHAANDALLLKQTCIAVNALTSTYHAGQTKFATLGGCRAICHALRVCEDLSALTHVLRTIATLALRNSYVQDYFQLENTVELLLAKKDEITTLSTRSESFETKSQVNLLLLSLEFALDTVRIPASHHNASHDLATIAFLAGTRRATGRLGTSSSHVNSGAHLSASTAAGLFGDVNAVQERRFNRRMGPTTEETATDL